MQARIDRVVPIIRGHMEAAQRDQQRTYNWPTQPQEFHPGNQVMLLVPNAACKSWILDFLTGRPQSVQIGNSTSSATTLNTGAPQGCVLSPLLFTLLTHDCAAMHISNHIIKFADDTTVVGLISKNDESAYRGAEAGVKTTTCL
ncbi:hypothetical protein QTP70_001446 [Hemibagrus guttatus]|uniref:Reverse transcriptase domain-containing protein n=1 Tax=Hemibagrus guttatus TaxID=175788 RepID=A0AAE0UZA1_9TELE|nr:hypothetical protein QTP70_001446 [Hemibagrus guttatus]KAK3557786.1 hypothetical protein QTP86_000742 [Hemibagrus guttatus]